jgi:hypothetical protein
LTQESVTAERHYREARARAAELGMRPLVAHCHLGLARLQRRIGAPDRGREHLGAAMALYREMGMRHWLEEAEALDPETR